jgi:hypothetical protein
MATILIETDLDVISKQRELVTEALSADGVYIRAKETLEELLAKGEIKGTDRAKVVAETIAGMASQITASTMSAALQWTAQEKEFALKKQEMEYQLDILAQNKLLVENQVEASLADRQIKQAQLRRVYGTPTTDSNGDVIALGSDGKEYVGIQNVLQDTANKVVQNGVLGAQKEQTYAATHKLVADTYVNHGVFQWSSLTGTGMSGVTKTSTGYVTLTDLQKETAKEQAKGYAWNAWSNAASSSAGMLGTLVAAEIPELVDDAADALVLWTNVVTNLKNVTEPQISI